MLSACPACQGSTPALNKITWSWMSAIPAHRCRRIRIKIVLYCIVNPDQSGLGEIPFQTATEAEPRLFPSPLAPSPDQDFPLSTVTASPLPASSHACRFPSVNKGKSRLGVHKRSSLGRTSLACKRSRAHPQHHKLDKKVKSNQVSTMILRNGIINLRSNQRWQMV